MCSGMNNLFWKIIWVIVYAITAYFTFTGKMMMAIPIAILLDILIPFSL